MASAAAVGADDARSPISNDMGEDKGLPGEITSGVYTKDEGIPDINGDMESSDEELPSNPIRAHKPSRRDMEDVEEGDAGNALFGDDEDEAAEEKEEPA